MGTVGNLTLENETPTPESTPIEEPTAVVILTPPGEPDVVIELENEPSVSVIPPSEPIEPVIDPVDPVQSPTDDSPPESESELPSTEPEVIEPIPAQTSPPKYVRRKRFGR